MANVRRRTTTRGGNTPRGLLGCPLPTCLLLDTVCVWPHPALILPVDRRAEGQRKTAGDYRPPPVDISYSAPSSLGNIPRGVPPAAGVCSDDDEEERAVSASMVEIRGPTKAG